MNASFDTVSGIHMLQTLAVANYRSINKLVIPLGRLNLITGPNGITSLLIER